MNENKSEGQDEIQTKPQSGAADETLLGDESSLDDTYFYCKSEYEGSLDFSQGEIEFSNYSYEIGSTGRDTLNKEETKKLYLAMKNYYEK